MKNVTEVCAWDGELPEIFIYEWVGVCVYLSAVLSLAEQAHTQTASHRRSLGKIRKHASTAGVSFSITLSSFHLLNGVINHLRDRAVPIRRTHCATVGETEVEEDVPCHRIAAASRPTTKPISSGKFCEQSRGSGFPNCKLPAGLLIVAFPRGIQCAASP